MPCLTYHVQLQTHKYAAVRTPPPGLDVSNKQHRGCRHPPGGIGAVYRRGGRLGSHLLTTKAARAAGLRLAADGARDVLAESVDTASKGRSADMNRARVFNEPIVSGFSRSAAALAPT